MSRPWAPIVGVYAAILFTLCLVIGGFIATSAALGGIAGVRGLLTSVSLTTVILSFSGLGLGVGATTPFLPAAIARLRLGRPDPLSVVIAAGGVLGTSFFLDGLIGFLGLQDVGALADIRDTLGPLAGLEKLGAALVIGFGPGLGEELFFRGYVLRRLTHVASVRHGLIASSLAFGLFHLDFVQGPAAVCLGLYLGLSVLYTGSLWTGVIAHALNNMAATGMAMVEIEDLRAAILMLAGLVASISGLLLLRERGGRLPP